jgi:hypothetical protein
LQSGQHVGSFRVGDKLGAGGMGEVWRARDTRLDREVALKLLPAGFADDPDRHARFEREAKLLASLNHPNIAHLYGLEHLAVDTDPVPGPRSPVPDGRCTAFSWETCASLETVCRSQEIVRGGAAVDEERADDDAGEALRRERREARHVVDRADAAGGHDAGSERRQRLREHAVVGTRACAVPLDGRD